MGIEYCLANKKDKTCFELGKSKTFDWFMIADYNGGDACLLYKESLYNALVESLDEDDEKEYLSTCERLSEELYNFVNNADPSEIVLCNDCDDSKINLRESGYRWVGSRYLSDKEDNFKFLNRHLK